MYQNLLTTTYNPSITSESLIHKSNYLKISNKIQFSCNFDRLALFAIIIIIRFDNKLLKFRPSTAPLAALILYSSDFFPIFFSFRKIKIDPYVHFDSVYPSINIAQSVNTGFISLRDKTSMQIVKYGAQVCGCRQHANSLNKHKLLSVRARLNLVQRSFGPVRTLARDLQITERNVRSKWTDETFSLSLSRSLQPLSSDSISVPSLSWSTFCQITAQVYTFTAHRPDFSPISHSGLPSQSIVHL